VSPETLNLNSHGHTSFNIIVLQSVVPTIFGLKWTFLLLWPFEEFDAYAMGIVQLF